MVTDACAAWELMHPLTLDDYVAFLDDVQRLFGPFAVSSGPWRGDDYRL